MTILQLIILILTWNLQSIVHAIHVYSVDCTSHISLMCNKRVGHELAMNLLTMQEKYIYIYIFYKYIYIYI